MADVAIKSKPAAPSTVTATRSGNTYKANWKFGSSATKGSNSSRIQHIDADLSYHVKGGKTTHQIVGDNSLSVNTKSISSTYKDNKGNTKNRFKRDDWYPYTSKKLDYMIANVRGKNSKGYGKEKHDKFEFYAPKAPTISDPKIDGGVVKFAVSTSDSSGHYERAYVNVKIERTINFNPTTGATIRPAKTTVYNENILSSIKGASWSRNITESAWNAQINNDQYIRYDITATAKGIAGYAQKKKSITICYATGAVIENVKTDQDTVTAYFKFADSFDGVKHVSETYLEYADSSAKPSGGWSKIDDASSDSGKVIALGYARNRYTATVGNFIWLRVVTTYLGNDNLSSYSAPFRVDELYNRPEDSDAPSEATLKILDDSFAGADGTSAYVYVGWTEGDYSGTEISWSTDPDAWESTEEPKSKQLEDAGWNRGAHASSGFPNYTRLKVAELDEGTTYYFRARRFNVEDSTLMTSWTNIKEITTGTLAAGVVCSAPSAVAQGDPVDITWLIGGGKEQKSWSLIVNGETVAGANDGSLSCIYNPGETETDLEIKIRVVTDNEDNASVSEPVSVSIKPKPRITSVSSNRTITTKPHQFTVGCSIGKADIKCQLIAEGVAAELPDGDDTQYNGDVIWEEVSAATSRSIPSSVHLIDTASYRLVVTPYYDGITGDAFIAHWQETIQPADDTESSQIIETELMNVSWAHQAVGTTDCDVIIDSGAMTAQITPQPPSDGYSEGDAYSTSDVCDIYRNTADGCYLIAQGVKFGSTVTDRWAAYGEGVSYRVATRTVDGDVDWTDFAYDLSDDRLRIDFNGEQVALKWGVSCSDSWEKNVKVRTYLDGSSRGNWNAGALRSKEIAAVLLRDSEASQIKALNDLAKYPGSAFIRTPNGEAFEASVNISGFGGSNIAPIASVTINCTEVDCSTFVVGISDITEAN